MLKLRPYKPCDAYEITKWFKSEYSFRLWSADRYKNYPITPEDMNAYYDNEKFNGNIWAMTAFDDTGVKGHLMMRFPNENYEEIRFGFIVVDSEKRGMGFGRQMISLAIKYAFEFLGVSKITLGVFENNPAAMKCYLSCGFKRDETAKIEQYKCMGEIWNCIPMCITRDDLR